MSYQALELNGSGYASIAHASQTGLDMGLSDFMIEVRIKLLIPVASQGANARLLQKWDGNIGYLIRVYLGDQIYLWIRDGANDCLVHFSSSYLDDLRWHTITFSVDKSSSTGAKIFIDGNEVTYISQQDPSGVGNINNSSNFAVGANRSGGNRIEALYDELRVWNFGVGGLPTDYAAYIAWRAEGRNVFLATSEYDSDSWASYVTNNLSAYYKFDGDYTDETSNGNDLTVGGTGNAFPGYTLKKQRIISPRSIF